MVHIGRAARAIGRTLEFDDDGAIDEAVEHRHSERSISQVFGPCIEINVGDEDSRTDLVPAGYNFVEKVRCLRTLFTLDAVESELVDDEDVPLCVMFEGFVEGLISHGSGEFGNHLSGGCIEGAVSERTCAESDGLHEMAFADTGLADENWSRGRIFASARENDLAVYVRDQHVRDSQLSLSGTAAHGIFVHLYLNGIYWGVYNAVERPDRRFLASYYGGDSADWFAINHSGVVGKPNHPRWYITVYRYAREHDLSEPAKYREMKTLLNTAQFSDYILLNWFSGTGDWGKKNWYGGIRIHPPGAGLYFCWDAEVSYGLYGKKYGHTGAWVPPSFVSGGTSVLHQLWMALADSPEFRLEFADRVYRACYNGGPLADSVNKANFRRLADYVERV